jgi:hypothetical protein
MEHGQTTWIGKNNVMETKKFEKKNYLPLYNVILNFHSNGTKFSQNS